MNYKYLTSIIIGAISYFIYIILLFSDANALLKYINKIVLASFSLIAGGDMYTYLLSNLAVAMFLFPFFFWLTAKILKVNSN